MFIHIHHANSVYIQTTSSLLKVPGHYAIPIVQFPDYVRKLQEETDNALEEEYKVYIGCLMISLSGCLPNHRHWPGCPSHPAQWPVSLTTYHITGSETYTHVSTSLSIAECVHYCHCIANAALPHR